MIQCLPPCTRSLSVTPMDYLPGRKDYTNKYKFILAEETNRRPLPETADAMTGADFSSVSAPEIVKKIWSAQWTKMQLFCNGKIRFREIWLTLHETRAAVVGTGRSDFLTRSIMSFISAYSGGTDARATRITDEMKIAAAMRSPIMWKTP